MVIIRVITGLIAANFIWAVFSLLTADPPRVASAIVGLVFAGISIWFGFLKKWKRFGLMGSSEPETEDDLTDEDAEERRAALSIHRPSAAWTITVAVCVGAALIFWFALYGNFIRYIAAGACLAVAVALVYVKTALNKEKV